VVTESPPVAVLHFGQNQLLLRVRTKRNYLLCERVQLLLGYDQYDHSHNFFYMCDVIFNLSAVFFVVPEEIIIQASTKKAVMA